jgi:two-component system, NarL family, response regulator LiaR
MPAVPDKETIRIIFAEDHVLVREGTRQLLDRHDDLEVVGEAADGIEAVELVRRLSPDLAILDIAMPRMGGIEATRQIKALAPKTSVLILTAYDDDQYVFALLEAGAAGYLLKDVSGDELVRAVRAVHAGEPVLHPAIARKVLARFAEKKDAEAAELPRGESLSEREIEVLRLAARGMSNAAIAQELALSARTVQVHLTHIFAKLGVASRTEAVIAALRLGWFSLEELT